MTPGFRDAKTVDELLAAMAREEVADRVGRSARCAKLRVQTRRIMYRYRADPLDFVRG